MLRAIAFGLVGYLTGDVVGDAKDAFTLADVREPTLTIVCEPCGRRGRESWPARFRGLAHLRRQPQNNVAVALAPPA